MRPKGVLTPLRPRTNKATLLVPLIKRLARAADATALRELHENRTPFRIQEGPALSMMGLLDYLRQSGWARVLCGRDALAVDRAYDMTVAKFLERPQHNGGRRGKGPDCRRYYRGFLAVFNNWRSEHPSAGPLEEEAAAAVLLQRYVVHQFRKSCEEIRRAVNPARSRYTWQLPQGTIVVYIPVSLAGGRRREWLDDNIDNPDPTRPGERERVQVIINTRLGVPRRVPLGGNGDSRTASLTEPSPMSPFNVVITVEGLAKAVADEKVNNLDRQRPAIRALGRRRLSRLIRRAIHDLHGGRYQEKRLAEEFGLSRPTLSRFAGSRWRTRLEKPPPDLYSNIAQVLAANNDFVEAAKCAGVWPRVRQVTQLAAEARARRHRHA